MAYRFEAAARQTAPQQIMAGAGFEAVSTAAPREALWEPLRGLWRKKTEDRARRPVKVWIYNARQEVDGDPHAAIWRVSLSDDAEGSVKIIAEVTLTEAVQIAAVLPSPAEIGRSGDVYEFASVADALKTDRHAAARL